MEHAGLGTHGPHTGRYSFLLLDENSEHPEFENTLFIPFDYRTPPAPNAVGCEVDGTFFLLFNELQKERHP